MRPWWYFLAVCAALTAARYGPYVHTHPRVLAWMFLDIAIYGLALHEAVTGGNE
jgi:hypothetical protein